MSDGLNSTIAVSSAPALSTFSRRKHWGVSALPGNPPEVRRSNVANATFSPSRSSARLTESKCQHGHSELSSSPSRFLANGAYFLPRSASLKPPNHPGTTSTGPLWSHPRAISSAPAPLDDSFRSRFPPRGAPYLSSFLWWEPLMPLFGAWGVLLPRAARG